MSAVPEGLTPLPHADAIGKAMASTFAVALDRFDAAARTWGRVQEYGSRACDDAAIKAEYEEAREALAAFGRHLPGEAASIVRIRVFRMDESCERTTFFVELKTDEGFTMTPCCHRTGSVYTNGEGLSVEEARDRALTEALEWGDLLRMTVEPYAEDGVTYESSFPLETYTTQRAIAAERSAAD
jgi:hypothetical protein